MNSRQYYYRVSGCLADNSSDAHCKCWHDEGTGPLPKDSILKTWRDKPEKLRIKYVNLLGLFNCRPGSTAKFYHSSFGKTPHEAYINYVNRVTFIQNPGALAKHYVGTDGVGLPGALGVSR